MDKKLRQTLKQTFTAPPMRQRERFINSIAYPKAKFSDVLISQIGFIRKRVWVLFAVGVVLAFSYTSFIDVPENIITVISAILPLFSVCTITEIYKSIACNMEEMELTCKYNLPKIILMRLGILGTVNFVMLIFCIMCADRSNFGALRNTIYLSVPYLLSNCISFLIISKIHSREIIYICSVVCGSISIFMMIVNSNYQFIYKVDFTLIWIITCILLAGLLVYTLANFIKSQEELRWSLL